MDTQNEGIDPAANEATGRMKVLDEASCIELIDSTPVGRVAFVDGDTPLVLPVNHVWWEESIVFRALEGKKLAAAAEHQRVCFEVDHWDASDRSGWSVVVQGAAREITGWAERAQLEEVGLVPWAKEEWRTRWIRIDPTEISGRILASGGT